LLLTYLIFLETRINDLHFATHSMGLSSFNFFLVASIKRFFLQVCILEFKVIQGANLYTVFGGGGGCISGCSHCIIAHVGVSPILRCFRDILQVFVLIPHHYSILILGVFCCTRSSMLGSPDPHNLKPINCEIIFKVFQPM